MTTITTEQFRSAAATYASEHGASLEVYDEGDRIIVWMMRNGSDFAQAYLYLDSDDNEGHEFLLPYVR